MNLIMRQPKPHNARRAFLGTLGFLGTVLEPDFDNDNERPPTAEPLDWHNSRHWPVVVTD